MAENNLVTLKLIGFNEVESNNLQVILSLAARALQKKWQIVEESQADFFLLSAEAAKNVDTNDALKSLPANHCLFCTREKHGLTDHSLYVDEKHLPSLSLLVTLFNRVSSNDYAGTEGNTPEVMPQAPVLEEKQPVSEHFDVQQGLLGYLLTTEHELLSISLPHNPDYPPLYIDAEKSVYCSQNSLEQLEPYLSAELKIKSCSKAEIENCVNSGNLKPHPLKNLIWYIVIQTSAGRVIKDHQHTDIVTLKGWPDLKLFRCLDYAKVATFMKNNAATLDIVSEYTKRPIADVIDFHNACYLMGLVEKRNQLEINKKNLSSERLELLNKIDARLK
jgi:hypothetical protein